MHAARRSLQILTIGAVLGAGLLTAGVAKADPVILFGEGPDSLAVDEESGKITAEGKKTALSELDRIPGEDAWDLRVYIEMPKKAAEGPLYFEFFRPNEEQPFWRWEGDYGGERYFTASVELKGSNQFNKDTTYRVKVIQVGESGKDIKLIEGKLKLINTGREPQEDDSEEEDVSEQDALDSLGGDDEEEEAPDAPAPAEPPPVSETPSTKKGCSMTGAAAGFNGLMILGLLGLAGVRRRRRDA